MEEETQLYQKIRLKREEKNWSQQQLAEAIGMPPAAYAKIEQGITQITVERLQAIAKALQTSLYRFLGKEDETVINNVENNNCKDFSNQIGIIQNSFEHECKAYLSQIDKQEVHFEHELKAYQAQIETLKETIAIFKAR